MSAVELENALHHADVLKLAHREIKRLQNALDRIYLIASNSPGGTYMGSGYSRELDMSFDLGRIEAIAQFQRDVKVAI